MSARKKELSDLVAVLFHVVVRVLVSLDQREPISIELERCADVEVDGAVVVLTTGLQRRLLDTTSLQELTTWNSWIITTTSDDCITSLPPITTQVDLAPGTYHLELLDHHIIRPLSLHCRPPPHK